MNTEFLPEADAEFREAVRYYEEEASGVGMTFIAEVHRTISSNGIIIEKHCQEVSRRN
jgi:hypothetical protein